MDSLIRLVYHIGSRRRRPNLIKGVLRLRIAAERRLVSPICRSRLRITSGQDQKATRLLQNRRERYSWRKAENEADL